MLAWTCILIVFWQATDSDQTILLEWTEDNNWPGFTSNQGAILFTLCGLPQYNVLIGADRNLVAQRERVCNCFAIMEINTDVHHIRHKSKTLIRGELSHDHRRRFVDTDRRRSRNNLGCSGFPWLSGGFLYQFMI